MDILTMLKGDHAKVKGTLEALEHTTTRAPNTRAELIGQVEHELHVQMDFEETVLYPVLEQIGNEAQRERTLQAYAEHEHAQAVLDRLMAIDPTDPMWKANLAVLRIVIEHHLEAEEDHDGLFAVAHDLIPARELLAMADRYAAAKARPRSDRMPYARPLRSVVADEVKARSARIHDYVVRT